jgi:gas vesicle protein
MRDECGCGTGNIFLSFILGGVVGAGVALLLAPQSGRETRQKIRKFTEDVKDKTADYVDDVKEKVTSGIDKGKELYEEKKTVLSSAIEAGKEAYEKEKERFSKEESA